ncbi:hypothetical protein H7U22_09645 [Pedobacter sp. CCM 8938]|uniref:PA14 domain-containing protein n=2 Tax=Pedobacter fastidiosus TaxID=2765361 RepID=A0ABR7KS72_9SPHI|nr:hypothetical protein [Pedobacter fastidiosus]MBC6110690.1 hypothetical protein [Pedobacter fastidiosus]
MIYRRKKGIRRTAGILLAIWLINLLLPSVAHALTSGPSQPESQSFQPVGTSDMVDLLSGDFKYNIPLMDVDGYPLNLAYQSGIGPDDEASWVGLGWNLNVGSISRQLRGLPDDLKGDLLRTEHAVKDKVTVGGRLTTKVELVGNSKIQRKLKLNGSLTFGVFSDSYTGIGAEIGANAGMSFAFANEGMMTAGLGLGVLSSTASGVDITPNVSMSINDNSRDKSVRNAGLSSSLGYNSRSGMKSLTLGGGLSNYNTSAPLVSYNTEPVQPKIQVPYISSYDSYSIDLGGSAGPLFIGGGLTGYRSVRRVSGPVMENPEYGFLYSESGKNKPNAVHDFIREKENPVIPEIPNLAIPIHTPDIFTYNSQIGSGQFRLYRGGTGIFYDNRVSDKSTVSTVGADVGWGFGAHYGVTKFDQYTSNTTQKWTKDNSYLAKGDFQDEPDAQPQRQHVFFKKPDERNIEDSVMTARLNGTGAMSVSTSGRTAGASFRTAGFFASNVVPVGSKIEKEKRQESSTSISYLTASEAKIAGLDTVIKVYPFNDYSDFDPARYVVPENIERISPIRRAHHISEITVLNEQGQRSVYGLPVYSKKQEEISFAVDNAISAVNGKVALSMNGQEISHRIDGTDEYLHRDIQPAYAASYLLTGVLSPDYVDRTRDGITPDDNGTAIKFSYSKIDTYRWRTPYNLGSTPEAALNRSLLADPKDDRGSVIYGEKELYYVRSIESKTKIAFFITQDREDALGVTDFRGERDPSVRQKCLKEIRLYSKDNLSRPIKVVKFGYSYDLCPGTPNSMAAGGRKLTLKLVWFEYGSTHKGVNHPYVFTYGHDAAYGSESTDRWGTYKPAAGNPGALTNEQYPYSDQNRTGADQSAAVWLMTSIQLPSGGIIDVRYESDDYAYVQDRHASVMAPFKFYGSDITSPDAFLSVSLDSVPLSSEPDLTAWFKKVYLNGSDYLYTKSTVKLSTPNAPSMGCDDDFISAYVKITQVIISGSNAHLKLEPVYPVSGSTLHTNPIRFAAWQKMKNEYPRYAYPGYENRVKTGTGGAASAIAAIANAARNLSELRKNFYEKASESDRHFCDSFTEAKSFCRISMPSKSKIGGGVRVKQIRIRDEWDSLTGTDVPKGIYGQDYSYTTTDENGRTVSSGVATYEPAVGSDENPLRQPVFYSQKVKGGISNFFELEAPFCESLYPAPSVGYGRVTVKDYDPSAPSQNSVPKTGFSIYEFYTAREFPVRVTVMPIEKHHPDPGYSYSLVESNTIEELVLSQGYSIELNDMHGKPRSERTFNSGSSEISSTEYEYQVENPAAPSKRLDNRVKVITPDSGLVKSAVIGRDIEFFTDFREQESINSGFANNTGVDLLPFLGVPSFPLPHFPIKLNSEYKLFRSACALKVIQTNGIISRVTKRENGSSIAVDNLAFDGVSGEALVTRTQNEFNKVYYSVNIPAYWPYRKMGGAYQNQGMMLKKVVLNSFSEINENYWELLTQGDELVNLGTGEHYWAVDNRAEIFSGQIGIQLREPSKILINSNGSRLSAITGPEANHSFKVVRSGYRNILAASAESIVCMNSPIASGRLLFASTFDQSQLKVITASATTYDDEWPVDGKGQVSERKESTASVFTYRRSQSHLEHGRFGSRIYNICDELEYTGGNCGVFENFSNSYLNSRMVNTSIWPNTGIPESLSEPVGFVSSFYAPTAKLYYIGFAGDDRLNISIDGSTKIANNLNNVNYWSIYPVYLPEGNHTIEVEGYNIPNSDNNWAGNPGAMAVEVYDNSRSEIIAATGSGSLTTLFTTATLPVDPNFQTFRTVNGIKTWRFTYETYFNPFQQGLKGNWRPYEQQVFQVNRSYDNIFNTAKKGVNLANAGMLKSFMSYWVYSNKAWMPNLQSSHWVSSNRVKQYDRYGQEEENRDALNRSSSACFDFSGQLPAAVASNAMRREIYVSSFEDRNRSIGQPDTSETKEFTSQGQGLFVNRTNEYAHTGHYSVALPQQGIKLETIRHLRDQKSAPYLGRTVRNEFTLLGAMGLYPRGFEPKNGGEYLISMWIRDGQPLNRNVNIGVSYGNTNGSATAVLACKAVVEGWKLIEGRFTVPVNNSDNVRFSVGIVPYNGLTVYADDIRIHPVDAHMKSYAYDDRNFRLMAELDENGFATFYEYDDEGSLIRVKKETERGIATIKENRSSYRTTIMGVD